MLRTMRQILPVAFTALLFGCGGAEPPPPPTPLDAGQVARGATNASMLDHPYRIEFAWSLTEPGVRIRGRGVARVEPPARARVDLFLPNGERVAAAALVDDDMRLPPGIPVILPPPALFWATFGVFRPGGDASLSGGSWRRSGEAELRYLNPGGEILYGLRGALISEVRLRRGGDAHEEVRLTRAEGERFPREAVYRHLREVRELRLTVESVEAVESYPPTIWMSGGS